MIDGYISIKEASEKWSVSARRIQMFCVDGRIHGAAKLGREWAIPSEAERPSDQRIRSGKYKNWRSSNNNISSNN